MTTIMWELRKDGDEEVLDRFHSPLNSAGENLNPKGFTQIDSFHWVHPSGFNLKAETLVGLEHLNLNDFIT